MLLTALSRLTALVATSIALSIFGPVLHGVIAWSLSRRIGRVERAVDQLASRDCGEHRARLDEHQRWLSGHEDRIRTLERRP